MVIVPSLNRFAHAPIPLLPAPRYHRLSDPESLARAAANTALAKGIRPR